MIAPDREPHVVLLVVPDRCNLLDLAGPAEAFRLATLVGVDPGYELVTATADGRPVRADCGIQIVPDVGLDVVAKSGAAIDTLVVVGGLGTRAAARDAGSSPTCAPSAAAPPGSRRSAPAPSCWPPPACSTATGRRRTGRAATTWPPATPRSR